MKDLCLVRQVFFLNWETTTSLGYLNKNKSYCTNIFNNNIILIDKHFKYGLQLDETIKIILFPWMY